MRKHNFSPGVKTGTFLVLGFLLLPIALWAAEHPQGIFIDDVQVVFMESFPLQAEAVVKGNLGDPCVELGEIKQRQEGNKLILTITSQRGNQGCIAVLEPFVINIPLSIYGLKAGEYQLEVNGVETSFVLQADNCLKTGSE